jgi:TetR/AcrR family transcriptional regulator
MNQFVERIELAIKQALRVAVTQGQAKENEVSARANMITSLVVGRWHRFAKTGFKHNPSEGAQAQIALLLA